MVDGLSALFEQRRRTVATLRAWLALIPIGRRTKPVPWHFHGSVVEEIAAVKTERRAEFRIDDRGSDGFSIARVA